MSILGDLLGYDFAGGDLMGVNRDASLNCMNCGLSVYHHSQTQADMCMCQFWAYQREMREKQAIYDSVPESELTPEGEAKILEAIREHDGSKDRVEQIRKIQNQYNPNYASPPGETLLETLQTIGMSQAELAERTGRPKKTINEIIKGKAFITPDTALQLEKVLGISASFWNNRENHYREALAQVEEQERLENHLDGG